MPSSSVSDWICFGFFLFLLSFCCYWNVKIIGNFTLPVHLFGKFLTSNFLHFVSVPAAFTHHCIVLSEFMIFSLSLTRPFHSCCSLSLSEAVSSSPPPPSWSRLLTSLFLNTLLSPLLLLLYSMRPEIDSGAITPCSIFSLGRDTFFLSSYKSADLLHIETGEFNYLHIAFSFCLCFSLTHFPISSHYIHSPLLVQKLGQQQAVVAPRWRLCRSVKN